jgi:hypothetical protein
MKIIHISQALTCPEYIMAGLTYSSIVQAPLTVVHLRKGQLIPSSNHVSWVMTVLSTTPTRDTDNTDRCVLFTYDYLPTLQLLTCCVDE